MFMCTDFEDTPIQAEYRMSLLGEYISARSHHGFQLGKKCHNMVLGEFAYLSRLWVLL